MVDEPHYSFDEYELYYESTEKVTDRRLATNAWNYGICTAIIVAVAVLANWSVSRPEFGLITVGAIVTLAGMGMLLCTLWIGQIRDFKSLNNAKYAVLNAMAPLVRFGPKDDRLSATPFAKEWEILKARESTREIENMKIFALRSSNTEFLVPTAFRWVFGLMVLATVATTGFNFASLVKGALILKQPTSVATPTLTAPTSSQTKQP
jgi:hypothetical protein